MKVPCLSKELARYNGPSFPLLQRTMSKPDPHPLIEPFLDALWLERGLSDNTVSSYRSDLEKFSLWLDEQGSSLLLAGMDEIQHYLAWRADHQFAASSPARFLSALRRFYQYLNREKLRSDDPTVLLEGPKLPKKLPSDLSETEVEALLSAPLVDDPLELRDKAMLELLYATGLRVSELVGLTAEHVSLRQGLVRVVGKGNKERIVPVDDVFFTECAGYLRSERPPRCATPECFVVLRGPTRGGAMTEAGTRKIFRTHRESSGATRVRPHRLRHTYGTELASAGVDLLVLRELMGHSSPETTARYVHLSSDKLAAEFAAAREVTGR